MVHAVIHELCAVDTEMQLLYVLRCNNQLSVQPLFKEVPLSVCIWKWLFSGLSSLYLPIISVSCKCKALEVHIY